MTKLNKKPTINNSVEAYACVCYCDACECHCMNQFVYGDLDSGSKYGGSGNRDGNSRNL